MSRFLAVAAGATGAAGLAAAGIFLGRRDAESDTPLSAASRSYPAAHVYVPSSKVRTRDENLTRLQRSKQPFDVLVIGGGATGCMAALDAATRGLRVALVERDDFAAGTSSRSTKLIHGGVRYLENAVKHLDIAQYRLVREALHERSTLMAMAPHLTNPLPIMTPCYKWHEVPLFFAGLHLYDLISGSRCLLPCRYLNRAETLRTFPMINDVGLKGSLVYTDGQMNDSRLAVSLATTAASLGATVANHVEVTGLIKDESGRITGVKMRDALPGAGGGWGEAEEFDVSAKVVVNATGPFSDAILRLDEPDRKPVIKGSSGVHVILPSYYSPSKNGLIIPKTKDGRVVFLLPWLDATIAGTTDAPSAVTPMPRPREEEIDFILSSISDYLKVDVRRNDVLAAWSGIRPLVTHPDAAAGGTASISREHIVHVSPHSGLVSILGGKWTTARLMAEQGIDAAIASGGLHPKSPCKTESTRVLGAEGWSEAFFVVLAQGFTRRKSNGAEAPVDTATAKHLSHSYGTCALRVAEIAESGYGKKLAHGSNVLEAEVVYAIEKEYAATATDFIARRCRLAFLSSAMATQALPRVVEIMAEKLNWSDERIKQETADALEFIASTAGVHGHEFDDDD